MPARDLYHHVVRNALIKDGWTITHDPFRLSWGGHDMYVDLGAERLLAAEKDEQRIFVLRDVFEQPLGELLLEKHLVQVVGFDPNTEVIVQWKR